MYAIKINKTGRYICHCDKCWYETSGTNPLYVFSQDEARKVANQMKEHYVYSLTIEGQDGTTENVYHLATERPQVIEAAPAKKSLRKITVKR